jgi:hypothetical protein
MPLEQIIRRLSECEVQKFDLSHVPGKMSLTEVVHEDGPVPAGLCAKGSITRQFKKLHISGCTIRATVKDGCAILTNGEIVLVKNIVDFNSETFIVYQRFMRKSSFYEYPLLSSDINIYIVSKLSTELCFVRYESISRKCVCMPLKQNDFAVIPLAHKE